MAFKCYLDCSNENYALPIHLYHFKYFSVHHVTACSKKHTRGHCMGRVSTRFSVQYKEKDWILRPNGEASCKEYETLND